MQLCLKVNKGQQKLHRKNCVGGAPERRMCGQLKKYIMIEVFNTSGQLGRVVSRVDNSGHLSISPKGGEGKWLLFEEPALYQSPMKEAQRRKALNISISAW